MGLGGSQVPSTSITPAPGLSCALAPLLPRQQQLFLFPEVFSQQPSLGDGAAGGAGGAQGADRETGGRELCPSTGRLPLPLRPYCPLPGALA